ncbi:hypothetical protein B0H34DRAFT_427192 [Crassisporium funariophilum]|nr:hypothetical protein B0H34DRAFT_427192 [Crassisporium funariophilum]
MDFTLIKEGQKEPIADSAHSDLYLRSVHLEIELEAGTYIVYVRLDRTTTATATSTPPPRPSSPPRPPAPPGARRRVSRARRVGAAGGTSATRGCGVRGRALARA